MYQQTSCHWYTAIDRFPLLISINFITPIRLNTYSTLCGDDVELDSEALKNNRPCLGWWSRCAIACDLRPDSHMYRVLNKCCLPRRWD